MAGSTYSSNLKIELMSTGENSGTWGDITNTNLGTALEQAVVGLGNPDFIADANLTITITNSNAAQAARALVLNVTSTFGSLTATRELVVPTIQKQYIVQNNTTGGQSITVKTSAGTGITVPNGRKAHLYVDGTNVVQMFDFVDINGGAIDNTIIGGSTAAAGTFTTATATTGNITTVNATTVDATNVEVTNIKAKDGTAAVQIADTTGVVSVTAAPILTALTASQAVFTNASKALVSNAITGTGNVVMSASPTLTGTVTAAAITASGTVTGNGNWVLGNADTDTITQGASYVTGTKLRSAKTATNTLALSAYDVDGAAYTDLVTLTASNTPTLALTSTGVGTMDNISVGATTAAPGAFTTLTAGSTVTASGLTASQAVFTNASKELTSNSITGTGNVVMSNSPTLVTPILGTPTSVTLTNATGLPISTGVDGLGTGVATALAVNVGTAGSPVVNGGALGTPSSGTVTNLTGTASININGTVGATTANTGAFTTLSSTGNTTLGDASADTVTINGTVQPGVVISGSSTGDALRITQTGTGNALLVEDAANPDSTPVVIDASGRVIVGSTTNTTGAGGFNLQLTGTSSVAAGSSFSIFSNTNAAGLNRFTKSRSATINTNSIVLADDALGTTEFCGADGTAYPAAARIEAFVDGTPGTNDMPGRLTFSTTPDGSNNPIERVRISSTGQTKFSYNTVVEVSDATNAALRITQTGVGNALLVEDSTNPDSTPFAIDSSGRVIQGYTAAILTADDYVGSNRTGWGYQGNNTNPAGALFTSWNTTATSGAGISLSRSRSATVGTQAIVSSGDSFGGIGFNGDDGVNFIVAASISAEVDGTPGTNDMPGRLSFSTTADGASTPTERVRITSAGKTGFATAAPAATLHVAGSTILSNVNVLGATYDSVSFSVAGQDTFPTDLFFSPDGLKMYVLGDVGNDVNEYSLSTAWVISSAVFVTNFSVSSQETTPAGLFFRADGTKMYVVGTTNDTVYQYTLSTPWSVATASYDSISFSVAAEGTPNGLWFKPNGLSMYMVGSTGDVVYQYTLSTAWNVSTATFLQSFSVAGQESLPTAVTFTGDGSRMFVLGDTGNDVNVYNLTTPWDISTAAFVNVFSVSGQDTSPLGLYIKPDGTKMYMVGVATDTVYQYTVPSIDIQLTGPTSAAALDVQQDLTVYGNTTGSFLNNGFRENIGGQYYNLVSQADIGTAANEIPLNQYLGDMAYMNSEAVVIQPQASVTPNGIGDMVFQLTSDTSLEIKVKGSDGTVRSVTLTLA